jgi:hypothetical protein
MQPSPRITHPTSRICLRRWSIDKRVNMADQPFIITFPVSMTEKSYYEWFAHCPSSFLMWFWWEWCQVTVAPSGGPPISPTRCAVYAKEIVTVYSLYTKILPYILKVKIIDWTRPQFKRKTWPTWQKGNLGVQLQLARIHLSITTSLRKFKIRKTGQLELLRGVIAMSCRKSAFLSLSTGLVALVLSTA